MPQDDHEYHSRLDPVHRLFRLDADGLAAPGLAAAFAVSVLLGIRQWARGESVKVLDVGSLLLFGVLLLCTLIAAPDWTVATVRLAVDGGLLAIVLVSLAIGMPFTLQYARESVPHEFWTSPIFMTTNRRITGVWAAAFAVMTAADAAAHAIEAIPLWVDIAGSVVAFADAIWFTCPFCDVGVV